MQNLSCKLNIPLGPGVRDLSLEADLQSRIDDGHKVYVIGDVHGHLATFRALIHRLNLSLDDRVVCLGDMIDRGPDSAGVMRLIRSDERIICLKGNHEHMALQSITPDGQVELWQPWMQRGGKSCWASYIVQAEGDLYAAKHKFLSDMRWVDSLPNQIVLDKFRLVHAGYDPRMPLDLQGDKELLWIRKTWYNFDQPVDPLRCVIFGHTSTLKLGAPKGGDVAYAKFTLADGRPGWVAMDTGAYNHVNPGLTAVNLSDLSAIKQVTLRIDRWFTTAEPKKFLAKIRHRAKKWRLPENRKEAIVAESFGLKSLQKQRKSHIITEDKARESINKIGRLIPYYRGQNNVQNRMPFTWRRIARRAKHRKSTHKVNLDQWQHNGKNILLGPGTDSNRHQLQLPGPHSFTFYRSKQPASLTILQKHQKRESLHSWAR